jgi:phosphatidylserine/phosphatidylglycerophosphate/cardiolipin synthase-like enzyme
MINRLSRWQQFPWREKNQFQLLTDGSEIFPAMLEAINSAQSQILLEMYLIESGTVADLFISALVEAAERNVNVYLLLDDYGARGFLPKDRRQLDAAGVHTVYYNPIGFWNPILIWGWRRTLLRDHRKLLLVDDQFAFVGGMGITDNFDNIRNPDNYWHDVAVKAEGPVVYDWLAVFQSNWDKWTRKQYPVSIDSFTHNPPVSEKITPNGISLKEKLSGQAGRVASGRYFGRSEIQRAFVKRVLGAEHHVWMMTAYFVPLSRLLRALRLAARRGVDVRLLVPGPETDHPSIRYAGRRHFYHLLRAGVRIFEYQPRFLHAKVLLCDGWVSLGSSNVDRWNLRWNLEGNQEIEDSQFTHDVRELFEHDLKDSTECVLQDWRSRSWVGRWQEWFWGHIEGLIEKLSELLRRYRDKP